MMRTSSFNLDRFVIGIEKLSLNCKRKKMKKIKHVPQYDNSGCGIACVAMVTGRAYDEVKKMYEQMRNENILYRLRAYSQLYSAREEEMSWLLTANDVLHSMMIYCDENETWEWLPRDVVSLLLVEDCNSSDSVFHWVVFGYKCGKALILDPNFPLELEPSQRLKNAILVGYIQLLS